MFQVYEIIVHDLEVIGLNPGRVELGVYSTSVSTSVSVVLEPKMSIITVGISQEFIHVLRNEFQT